MSEKRKLLAVFGRVAIATKEAAKDITECRMSGLYSKNGLKQMEDDIRQKFREAMNLHSKDAMAIIDKQEKEYKSKRVTAARVYLKSDAQISFMANLEMLKSGLMSETDTEAFVLVYRRNDSAINAIRQVLIDQKSDLLELLDMIVTADMQYNAFNNMRNIVNAGMSLNTLERAIKMETVNRGRKIKWNTVLFPGYDAIEKDTDDDLLVMESNSTLVTIGGGISANGFKRVTKSVNSIIDNGENTNKQTDQATSQDEAAIGIEE